MPSFTTGLRILEGPARRLVPLLALCLVIAGLAAPPSRAQAPMSLTAAEDLRAGEMVVPLNKSQILRFDQPFTDVAVGNPAIADVMPLSDRSVYVLGKALGSTNISAYGPQRRLLTVVDVAVTYDISGLRAKFNELLPNEAIEVHAANDSLILNGTLSNAEQVARTVAIADRYAPGKVTNLLRVRGSQQVMLEVKVAEIARTTARELGIKPLILAGDVTYATLDPINLNNFGALASVGTIGDVTLDLLMDALEEKGVVKVLAEPNLIAMSGDTANFLAGGEFPVPVARDEGSNGKTTITIEFKPFGVSLAFTPTVIDGNLINLRVNPEVSQIDMTNAVTLQGFNIPGLSTRRATTTVELRDGQSFAIAGLLQNDFQDQIRQLPGLGELPVLGALFRSSSFQHKETELVITVTPHLVKPVAAGRLASPTDTFVSPSDAELFLLGRTEGTPKALLGAQAGGGIAGTYGHIIK